MLQILADENMPVLEQLFADFAKLKKLPGRSITADELKDIDILLTRSVTKVNESLLKNSTVKFVGSATIGVDHVDLDYLAQNDIAFANAPGCNAVAVAEYVLTAMAYWANNKNKNLLTLTVGIIGAGHTGSALAKKLDALNIAYKLYDPPLQKKADNRNFVSFDEILTSDVISCHVPLMQKGEDKTYHLIGKQELKLMQSDALLINSSRGPVVDNQALYQHLHANTNFSAVLDVWEGEPGINLTLLKKVLLATPHIAGYSYEGKLRGSYQIYCQACQFWGQEIKIDFKQLMLASEQPVITCQKNSSLLDVLLQAYAITHDSENTKQLVHSNDVKVEFDQLRKNYPLRFEYENILLMKAEQLDSLLQQQLTSLGFKLNL